MKPLSKVLIPAGGFGTRLLSATKAVPKELSIALRVSIIRCSGRRMGRTECDSYEEQIGPISSRVRITAAKSVKQTRRLSKPRLLGGR
jgi:hypothetical protein